MKVNRLPRLFKQQMFQQGLLSIGRFQVQTLMVMIFQMGAQPEVGR